MSQVNPIESLQLRKQTLLIGSSLNRLELLRETQAFQAHFYWLTEPVDSAREHTPLLAALAPLAGMFASRLLRSRRPGNSKLNLLIDTVRIGWPLWRQFAAGYFRRRD